MVDEKKKASRRRKRPKNQLQKNICDMLKKVPTDEVEAHRKLLQQRERRRALRITLSLKRTEKKKEQEKWQIMAAGRKKKKIILAKAAPGLLIGESFTAIPLGSLL
eukprot:GEMP01068631.1.p1 GENE.GEMP01068631.1~~GEMP01068631.1.p1  ORF type:complete len:106 (-),score=29.34 GEMP01068631.1:814-1131(-)